MQLAIGFSLLLSVIWHGALFLGLLRFAAANPLVIGLAVAAYVAIFCLGAILATDRMLRRLQQEEIEPLFLCERWIRYSVRFFYAQYVIAGIILALEAMFGSVIGDSITGSYHALLRFLIYLGADAPAGFDPGE